MSLGFLICLSHRLLRCRQAFNGSTLVEENAGNFLYCYHSVSLNRSVIVSLLRERYILSGVIKQIIIITRIMLVAGING